MSASIHWAFWKSTSQVGLPNGSCAQLMSPSRFGSNVTAANPAIVSLPAMIWSAVPAGKEASGPHAWASSAAVIAVPAADAGPDPARADATPLKPNTTAQATAPATQAVLLTVETIAAMSR